MSATSHRLISTIAVSAVLLAGCGMGSGTGSGGTAIPTTTTPVVRTEVALHQQLPGTLTFAGTYAIVNQAGAGVFTSLPTAGTIATRGQVLYRLNGRPIPLMYGDPGWRALAAGVADGPDVYALQSNLVALGFGVPGLRVDNHFDWLTAVVVRRWQASLGVPQTGAVQLGDVVWAQGSVRVTALHASVGMSAQPGQIVLDATSPQHAVLLQLDVSRQSLVRVGTPVIVTLPDGTTSAATVTTVGSVAVAQGNAGNGPNNGPPAATITVTITLATATAGGGLDEAPVFVDITYDVHKGVLAVPVTALIALPGGTYAVEIVESGHRRAVQVTTGLFDDHGLVEVSGSGLREGMSVEVPQP